MNNKSFKNNIEPKYFLLFSAVALILLIFLSYKFNNYYEPVKTKVNSVFVPVEKGINVIGSYINEKLDGKKDVKALRKELEALQADYDELLAKYNSKLTDSYELEELMALFELKQQYSDYNTVGANVIVNDTIGYNRKFTIDKGSKDGITKDMNVIAGNGLVGIITEVGPNYSVVRSIIDDNSNVSGTILKAADSCIVSGSLKLMDEGHIQVTEIPISSEVMNNYQVVTSTSSSKYLPNILIGYISNVTTSKDGLTKNAYLTPVVDFSKLKTVLIITDLKEVIVTE